MREPSQPRHRARCFLSSCSSARTGQAGAALAVAHVGLDGADEQGLLGRVSRACAVQAVDCGQLLAVAHDRARAVRLHILDIGGVDAGRLAHLPQH